MIIKVSYEHRGDADKEDRVSEGTGSRWVVETFAVILFSSTIALGTQNPKQDGASNYWTTTAQSEKPDQGRQALMRQRGW